MASTATACDTDTKLWLHCDGADGSTTFTDSSSGSKAVTPNASAQIDTAQSVFGGASGLFTTGDYLSVGDSGDWDFGTGDFTIDFRLRHSVVSSQPCYVDIGGTTSGFVITYYSGNLLIYAGGPANQKNFSWTPSQDTWYHIAVVRNGTNLYAFVGGSQIGTTQTDSTNYSGLTSGVGIGGDIANTVGRTMRGWIDELRIVKGTAVWTGDFTPPASAYTLPTSIKKVSGVDYASIKKVSGVAIASVEKISGVD